MPDAPACTRTSQRPGLVRHPSPRRPAEDDVAATQGAVLLHVYEELAQHLGQLEVTRDVLLSRNR